MSTENYVKYISEQISKEKVRGFTDLAINEGLDLTSEDYINMLHMYIEDLEARFEDEDLQQIQEISQDTMKSYAAKAAVSRNNASGVHHKNFTKSLTAYGRAFNKQMAPTGASRHDVDRTKFDSEAPKARAAAENDPKFKSLKGKSAEAKQTYDKRVKGLAMAAKKD